MAVERAQALIPAYLLDLGGLTGVLLVGVGESVAVVVAGVGLVGGVHEATCRATSWIKE